MALSPAVRAFLEEKRHCVLATVGRDGLPHQTVLWYELQGDRIMMNTKVGRAKEKNLRRDPRISFCIEDEYRYVTIKGSALLDYERERSQADIKALATRYYGPEKAEDRTRTQFVKEDRVSIYMTIESVEAHGF